MPAFTLSWTRASVELFHSAANRNNAQLVFATHDTNLLDGASCAAIRSGSPRRTRRGDRPLLARLLPAHSLGIVRERTTSRASTGASPSSRTLITGQREDEP